MVDDVDPASATADGNAVTSGEESSAADGPVETFAVNYSCLRCGTMASNAELSRLPEIKCLCGFRVFTKVRPPVVKTVKAV